MNILFDQGVPVPLRRALTHREAIRTVAEEGWATLHNGELLARAEAAGFAVFITTDQNLRYQQNLQTRTMTIVVLLSTSWPRIQQVIPDIQAAIDTTTLGGYAEVAIP